MGSASDNTVTNTLNRAEYTVYQQALTASAFNMALNEAEIALAPLIELPPSVRGAILPAAERRNPEHPDIRLARRARTIAELARINSERKVKIGIRHTLWVQAQHLEHLARSRLEKLDQVRKT